MTIANRDGARTRSSRSACSAAMLSVYVLLAPFYLSWRAREFDLCFSRFGMMFFSNPVAAMRNVRRALKPGGRLLFVTWRSIDDNPFLGMPKQVVTGAPNLKVGDRGQRVILALAGAVRTELSPPK